MTKTIPFSNGFLRKDRKLRKLEVHVLLSLFYLEPSTPMKLQLLLHRLPNPLSRNCGPPPNRRSLPSRAMKSSDCQQKLHSKPRKKIISFDDISCKLSPTFQSKLDQSDKISTFLQKADVEWQLESSAKESSTSTRPLLFSSKKLFFRGSSARLKSFFFRSSSLGKFSDFRFSSAAALHSLRP